MFRFHQISTLLNYTGVGFAGLLEAGSKGLGCQKSIEITRHGFDHGFDSQVDPHHDPSESLRRGNMRQLFLYLDIIRYYVIVRYEREAAYGKLKSWSDSSTYFSFVLLRFATFATYVDSFLFCICQVFVSVCFCNVCFILFVAPRSFLRICNVPRRGVGKVPQAAWRNELDQRILIEMPYTTNDFNNSDSKWSDIVV